MKRLIGRCLLFVCLFAGIANYVIYLQTGHMPARAWWGKLQSGNWRAGLEQLENAASVSLPASGKLTSSNTKVEVYKWTDADGVVHYGEKPGAEGATTLTVSTRGNSMAAPAPGATVGSAAPNLSSRPQGSPSEQGSPLEQARAAAAAMRAHNQAQEAAQ